MGSVVRGEFDGNDPHEIVRSYAANSPFRSAEAHELINEDNPFRRPVRPHDLAFLDYSKQLPAAKALRLSALIGHRMLRNIYDADLLYLPGAASSPSWSDFSDFYSSKNRIGGEQAAEVLENHLFSFLDGERSEPSGTGVAGLRDHVLGAFAERQANPGEVFRVATGCVNRQEAATFVLLQLSAVLPATYQALGRNMLGDYDSAHPALRGLLLDEYRGWVDGAAAYRDLFTGAGLVAEPVAYWQFSLTSSLSRANHLHRLSRNHELFGQFLGAWVHQKIEEAATGPRYTEVFAGAFDYGKDVVWPTGTSLTADTLGELFDKLVVPFHATHGQYALDSFYAGFEDARWYANLADRDLATQLAWADRLEEYKEKAEKLAYRIENEKIEIDLETFVESSDETSTTHVHDDHRLVVVEVGQMHFWNNVGKLIPMSVGDKLLIPAERLHGSVVRSGTCTYHQPVISEELLRAV